MGFPRFVTKYLVSLYPEYNWNCLCAFAGTSHDKTPHASVTLGVCAR